MQSSGETAAPRNVKPAWLVHTGVIVAVIGLLVIGVLVRDAITDRVSKGSLRAARVTSAGVLGLTRIHHGARSRSYSDFRLVLLDPATGARKARRILGSAEPECEEAQAGLLWCRTKTEVSLLELPSLVDRATWADLRRLISGLQPGITVERLRRSGSSIVVRANDGRDWMLRADPLEGTPAKADPELDWQARRETDVGSSVRVRSGTLVLEDSDGSTRTMIVVRGNEDPRAETRATMCQETYLEPKFLHPRAPDASPAGASEEVDGGAFVLHESSLSRAQSHMLVSRVGIDGCSIWTADLGNGAVQFATHTRGLLVVVGDLQPGEGGAIGLDDATGTERWRSSF